MSETFFEPVGGGRFRGLDACVGPWSADAMHGGPPSALAVRACEEAASVTAAGRAAGTAPLVALRATVDFLSGVPVDEVEVAARVVRSGRRIALTEATMTAGGRPVLTARTWLLATAPVDLDPHPRDPHPRERAAVPAPLDCPPLPGSWTFPYARAMEWRLVDGDPVGPGDAAVWVRPHIPVVPGEEPSGLQRAVLGADSASGVSAGLDWDRWLFVNVDLSVHLSRPLDGDWVCLDATSRYEQTGTGLATARLHDPSGPVGRSAQALLVTRR